MAQLQSIVEVVDTPTVVQRQIPMQQTIQKIGTPQCNALTERWTYQGPGSSTF